METKFLFICTRSYHSTVSYRLSLQPIDRNPLDVNMCLRHVMFDGCKWMQVVASGCSWMHIHTLGTRSARKHSHTAYGCVSIFSFCGCKMIDSSHGCCIWMNGCHSYKNDMYQTGKLHTCWTYSTTLFALRRSTESVDRLIFALDKEHIHTLLHMFIQH